MEYQGKEYAILDRTALQLRMDYNFTRYAIDVFKLAECLKVKLVKYSDFSDRQKQMIPKKMISQDGFTLINKSS